MEKSPFDVAVDIANERMQTTIGIIRQNFKHTKPFRREPISKDEITYYLSQITPEMRQELRQVQGDKTADDFEIFRQKHLKGLS